MQYKFFLVKLGSYIGQIYNLRQHTYWAIHMPVDMLLIESWCLQSVKTLRAVVREYIPPV